MRNATILGLVALAGCATAPGYRSSAVTIPPAFQAMPDTGSAAAFVAPRATAPARPEETTAAATAAAVEYWSPIGDTTLLRLIREVASANLDVQAARARVNAAHSDQTRAALDLTPTATLSGGYTRQRLSSATFPGFSGTFPDQNVWSAGFEPSWDLDVFGQIRHTVQARGAMVGVAEAGLRDVQVILTAELARAYFELRGAQEQLEVARRNADNQQRTFEMTQQRLAAGRGSAFDTERAQAQLSSTLASIPDREAAVAAAQYRIAVLVGRSPAAVAQELAAPVAIPPLPEVTSIGDPNAVVRNRPDVAAAERQEAVQRALVGAAKASYLPRVTIGGSFGYSSSVFNSIGDQATARYVVGPVITWPALSLGRVKSEVDAAQAREADARAQYSQTVLAALAEVETSLTRYRAARVRVERLQDASAASDRAAEIARQRFAEGITDFLQVLDAERTQLDAQDRLAQGRVDAATAYAALYRAVGGQ